MPGFMEALQLDLAEYEQKGGIISYPFPIEDFAVRVFGLDIQYEDFDQVFDSADYDPGDLFGCLFPDGVKFQGLDKIILINTNRAPFILANKEINKVYYAEFAERQTIAHEIGHYSDRYKHNKSAQQQLFDIPIRADDGLSIIVYPKPAETFANKYARHLLMPEANVIEFIHKHNIRGTFDLNAWIDELTSEFAVTRYMLEIRLCELGIHFTKGIYIKNFNRYRNKKYTEEDLSVLIDVAKGYNSHHGYYNADNFCQTYNKLTGQTRASGALYMALWRVLSGYYDKYPSVFEKRVAELAEIDIEG